jgi:putative ABC transport system permease protein
MIANYLKMAVRTTARSKGVSMITLSGLVIGMAAFLLIMQYVAYELSYDTFQTGSGDIYRVALSVQNKDNEKINYATNYLPVATAMKELFPEVVDYNRILYLDRHAVVSYRDKIFQQEGVIYADPSFFSFFSYPLLQGDPQAVLSKSNTVVISQALAKKYFGDGNPIGQFIKLNEEFNEMNLLVTGIHQDIPGNTHIKPNMVVSLQSVETLPETVRHHWTWPIYLNYVRLQQGADPGLLEKKLPEFANQTIQGNDQKTGLSFFLQPFSDIHLQSHLEYEIEENGSARMVWLLSIAALLILIIAYVNYVNLTTTKSLSRAREVGIRKVLGSGNGQLVRQFLTESAIFNVMAILLAAGLVFSVRNAFQEFTGIQFEYSIINTPWLWMLLVACLVVGTFFSALYPSVILASYKPVSALKAQTQSSGGSILRKSLVIFQFATTIGLMVNAYAIRMQLDHMRSQSAGIDINQILVVNAPRIVEPVAVKDSLSDHQDRFVTEAARLPGVQRLCFSSSIPGMWISKQRGIYLSGHEPERTLSYQTLGVDFNFINVYSLELMAGRNFSEQNGTDDHSVILTERAMHQLGISSPERALNERIIMGKNERVVIGVVKDYHHMSLHENYQAIIFYPEWQHKEFYSLRLDAGSHLNLAGTLAALETEWKKVYPSNPFEFVFLNDSFQKQYSSDVKFGKVFTVFTVLAIVLACLGLFGLTAFMTMKRTKEIGIRKVLGSTVSEVVWLLLKDVGMLLLWAGMIAMPFSYFSLTSWLSQFAFRIDLAWWLFAVPLISVFILALLAVSSQIIRVAMSNPVKSLKSE